MGPAAHVPVGSRTDTEICRSCCALPMISDEIRILLDSPTVGDDAPTLAHLEDTLTAGYARALALEAEHRRLERRLAEAAAELATDDNEIRISELRKLAKQLKSAAGDLVELRVQLASLSARAALLRAA